MPKNVKIMKTRWVHKKKSEAEGSTRYRSRLVVKGFSDNNHYDLSDAPVARLHDFKFLLILAAKFDSELVQYDVKAVFLNGCLDKLVYIEIPEGCSEFLQSGDNFRKDNVCESLIWSESSSQAMLC